MANVDEILLGKDSENTAASRLREEKALATRGPVNEPEEPEEEGTFNQQLAQKRISENQKKTGEAEEGQKSFVATKSAFALTAAWEDLLNPAGFILSLAYIDAHFVLNLIYGDKVFCDFGKEWFLNTTGSVESWSGKAKTIGFLEKLVMFFINIVFLILLGAIVALVVWILNPWNLVGAAPGAAWDWFTGLLSGSGK